MKDEATTPKLKQRVTVIQSNEDSLAVTRPASRRTSHNNTQVARNFPGDKTITRYPAFPC